MKRKLSFILSILLIFTFTSTNISLAAEGMEIISQEDMKVELDSILQDIESNIKGMEDDNNVQIEREIDDNIHQGEEEAKIYEREVYRRGIIPGIRDKYLKITGIIENQYKLKNEFVQNSKTSYHLITIIQEDIRDIKKEINYIFNNEDATLSMMDFYNIISELKTLNLEIQNNDYSIGSLAKTSREYIRLVIKLDFIEASDTFERIVDLQYDQIDLLNISNESITKIKSILNNS